MSDEWDFTKPQILEEGMKYTPIAPVKKFYVVPDNAPLDVELMSILSQVYKDYEGRITAAELQAAMEWFKCWTVAQLDKS